MKAITVGLRAGNKLIDVMFNRPDESALAYPLTLTLEEARFVRDQLFRLIAQLEYETKPTVEAPKSGPYR